MRPRFGVLYSGVKKNNFGEGDFLASLPDLSLCVYYVKKVNLAEIVIRKGWGSSVGPGSPGSPVIKKKRSARLIIK